MEKTEKPLKYIVSELDTKRGKNVKEAIEKNGGYCCCSFVKSEDTKCMCLEFRQKVLDPKWFGECHCGRYVKLKNTKKDIKAVLKKYKDEIEETLNDTEEIS